MLVIAGRKESNAYWTYVCTEVFPVGLHALFDVVLIASYVVFLTFHLTDERAEVW